MANEIDLFNLEDPKSVARKIITLERPIDLRLILERRVKIPEEYEKRELSFDDGNGLKIFDLIRDDLVKFSKAGYPENLQTPVFEAILNAYQHGNQRDPNKKITFAYDIGDIALNILVEDEGGFIDPVFVPFILRHRERDVRKKFINFYEFSGREKPKENNGTGTSFMHAYMDEVNYYLGERGMIVHLIHNKI